MSTRYYPLFMKGNPQLRVFLPNFWMKLIKPELPTSSDQVTFIVSMEMTKHDVKNYLEKIYNVPVKEVRTHVRMGKFRRMEGKGYIVKNDDEKLAFVTLPEGVTFKFPQLKTEESQKELEKDFKLEKETYDKFLEKKEKNWKMPGVPLWFGR